MNSTFLVEIILIFILGWCMSATVLPRISLVSFRRRLFDQVDSRKVHRDPIPRLGGIAFFPCIFMSVSLVVVLHNLYAGGNMLDLALTNYLLSLFAALFLLYLTGMMDDLIGVRYRSKFIIQILCGVLLVISGIHFDTLYGLFGVHALPAWAGMPLTVFITVFVLNAINLIDGIDGLASGLSIIAFLAFGFMFVRLGWWLYAFLAFSSFGVLLPFYYYNVFGQVRRGRKIFMGDTGSLTIGMLLTAMAVRLSMADPAKEAAIPGSIVVVFSFMIVPMLDVVRVVIHRVRCGKSPFLPDRNHIHHKFMALGMPQRRAMVSILCIAAFFALANVIAIHYTSVTLLFLADVLVWTLFHIWLTAQIHKKNKINDSL